MRRASLSPVWGPLTLAACSFPLGAMSSDSPEQCAGVSDDSARLACYDRIFRKPDPPTGANSAAAPGPAAASARTGVAGTSSAATTAAVSTPQDDFGLSEAAKRARDPETAKEQMPESLTGKVASVGRRPTGELVVTLENGQVWAQIQTDTKARVNAGDTVTIKKAALGSYLLVTPGKLATRVRRVK